ncbi:hypothetical protein HG535_0H03770 [Zygotorulaspora mrakii]|uniref:Uncharacterized protein n=1 Tax=Zygotorulaspora mrakii TaxID=42260 RepID=A0A7H9B9B7_ZYGMR|nr:uncharacterized protein HG535_0H03770 [Zygotorulaspora mrakii]QLG75050.1 hypothetical protein HG535_0H03770 [Zygotorulaspora mrakii]
MASSEGSKEKSDSKPKDGAAGHGNGGAETGMNGGGNSGNNRDSNPQQAMNEFLANPDIKPAKENSYDAKASNSNENTNSNDNDNDNDNDEYDYEMQDYRPLPFTSRGRSKTNYIHQYSMNGGNSSSAFPIQEVVPNTQMAISTSADTSGGASGGFPGMENSRSELRPRGQTVTTNVLHFGDIFRNNDDAASHVPSSRSRARGASTSGRSDRSGVDSNNNNNSGYGSDHSPDPRNVPMMVKPKTLYQNPQTPTVLPSTYHPINRWSTVKHSYLKEFLAEFMGTMVMVIFGSAVCCQVVAAGKLQQNAFDAALAALQDSPTDMIQTTQTLKYLVSSVSGGTFDDVAFGWAAAVVMGYFSAGGSAISGAHMNPSITVSNYIFRGFPAKKIPYYIVGQLLGGFVGALILFIFYKRVIEEAYPMWRTSQDVASMFCVFPRAYLSSTRQFVSEYICTAMLQAATFALTDPYTCLSSDIYPVMLFLLIYIINASMSYQTGSAMNMARDLGPRLALYALGFDRYLLWISHNHFFWVPMVAPFLGSITGALVYDICIYQGHESPVNWPLSIWGDLLARAWFRRPSWSRRKRARATSALSEFSYDDDEDGGEGGQANGDRLATRRTRTLSSESDGAEPKQKNVQFKSVQNKSKRFYGGIPTILEDENSIEAASLAGTGTESIAMSDTSSIQPFDDDIESSGQKKKA